MLALEQNAGFKDYMVWSLAGNLCPFTTRTQSCLRQLSNTREGRNPAGTGVHLQDDLLKQRQTQILTVCENHWHQMMWTGLQQQTQRCTKNKMTFSIYFQMFFYCAGGSSAPSGEALGSKKSGCCSSFKYFVGVRMWVAPTGNKILKAQQVPGESSLIMWDTNKYSAKVLLKSYKYSTVHRGQCFRFRGQQSLDLTRALLSCKSFKNTLKCSCQPHSMVRISKS